MHPDKNPADEVKATKDFQILTEAKMVLLDPEKRRNLDESLIVNRASNLSALPLLCSICTGAESRVASRCLNGMGHVNPLISEFNSASRNYDCITNANSQTSAGRNDFAIALQKVLKKFITTDLPRMYPLGASRKQKACSKEVFSEPTDLDAHFFAREIRNQKSSVPLAAAVVEILNLSFVRKSKEKTQMHSSARDIPVYDLSSLSSCELEQIREYFGPPVIKPFLQGSVIEELRLFIPKCSIESKQSDGYQGGSRHVCQQCGRTRFSFFPFLGSFDTCFACKNVCCRECLCSAKRKVPSSGSYDLRLVCKTCKTTSTIKEAETWLTHGQYLIETDKKYLEAAIAMYSLSNELYPSEIAIVKQAQALFYCEKHERLVRYGKDVLRTTTFERENIQQLQRLVAESLIKIADEADNSNLLKKADKYEEAIKWTGQISERSGTAMSDLKGEAMGRRLHCLELLHEREKMLLSHLIVAIREGSLLKVFTLLQDLDEEVSDACLNQLSTESLETYGQYGKLLLRLAKTMVTFKQDPSGAFSRITDIFWTGFSLFAENGSKEHIVDFVVHFACQLLKGRHSSLLDTLHEITPTNFLKCLYLTEDDIISPPDIEARWWKNVTVNGCDMNMFLKYEVAVKKLYETKRWSPVKVALSYYDLTSACEHSSQLLATLITSAQWFARQMSLPTSDDALQYSCKKMILKLTNLAAEVSFDVGFTHPHLQYYVARMVLGLQFYAASKAPCESQDDAKSIGKHLNWLVACGRLCPLHKMPIVSPSESAILHTISRDLYSEYLLKLQDELPPPMRPISEAILCYHIYENHLLKRCQLQDPTGNGLRLTAMTELLHAEDLSWDGVQQLLQWNMAPLDSEGWSVINHQLLEPVASSGIHQLVGLEINKHDFSIQLLIRKETRSLASLLCWEDIALGFTLNDPGCFFSLEAVTPMETPYHPFNKQVFSPKELQGSRFLNTLFHTDYLLKQFCTGFEISSYPPFHKRPIHEGLLKGLPNELQEALLSIPSRGPCFSRVNRFFVQADVMEYDVQESDDSIIWLFGNVEMTVRCRPLSHTQDGGLQDQEGQGPHPDGPVGSFIADFNEHYDQIEKHFPEFLRLKELCKVQWLGSFVASLQRMLEETSIRLESKEMDAKFGDVFALAMQTAENDLQDQLFNMWRKLEAQKGFIRSDEMVKLIRQNLEIPASYQEIHDGVRSGDFSVLAKQIARKRVPSVAQIKQQVIKEHTERLSQCRKSISTLKKDCKKCLPPTELATGSCWVPAVCHCEGKCIYGGVSLMPKPRKVTLRVRRDFSWVPLTPNFFGFHEILKQPPVKPFYPPRTLGRKVLLTTGVSPASNPPDGDFGCSSSPSDPQCYGGRGNISEEAGTSLKNALENHVLGDGNINVIMQKD